MSKFCLSACNVPHNKKNNTDTNSSIDFRGKISQSAIQSSMCVETKGSERKKTQREREREIKVIIMDSHCLELELKYWLLQELKTDPISQNKRLTIRFRE